jgi:hypothetical protein
MSNLSAGERDPDRTANTSFYLRWPTVGDSVIHRGTGINLLHLEIERLELGRQDTYRSDFARRISILLPDLPFFGEEGPPRNVV